MNSSLAKLSALKERVAGVQALYAHPDAGVFNNLKDSFLKEVEKLKTELPELNDFSPQNYDTFKDGDNSYMKFATRALTTDIEYFIQYLSKLETVQLPEVKVSKEGIYFAGQHFDALLKFNEIISTSQNEVILIDNYLNEKVLELIGSKKDDVLCRILTLERSLTASIKTFIEAFNKQHKNLEVRTSEAFHDRFIIIDKVDFYHFGASIKDAGRKGFMFSKIEQSFIKEALLAQFELEWNK